MRTHRTRAKEESLNLPALKRLWTLCRNTGMASRVIANSEFFVLSMNSVLKNTGRCRLGVSFSAKSRRTWRLPATVACYKQGRPMRSIFPFRFQLSTLNFSTLSPLESALTGQLRVSAEISRSCRRASPLESALTDFAPLTPFVFNTYTKTQGWGFLC